MQTPKAPKSIALASALLAVTITGSAARGEGTPVAQPMNTPLMSLMDRFTAAEAANPTTVPPPKPSQTFNQAADADSHARSRA